MAQPRLVVFDLDGTLIDSSLDLCNSVNAALAEVGKPALPLTVIASYIGDGAAMLVRRALGDQDDLDSRDPENLEQKLVFQRAFDYFLTYYRAHKLDNTRPYPGVLQALHTIRRQAPTLPMAVLTNKPVGPSRAICDALGLTPLFFANYGGNSFATKKPDPEGLLAIIAEAGAFHPDALPVRPSETVMVGDSDVDVRTARACGARSLGCRYGLSPEALAASQPDLTVSSPAEWPAALGLG